ncbi:MAG: hypothetical protein IH851_02055 [Armatimonadetes bacterium]|nr:hypothetical protein [Armatimonadota bacterium]
MTALIAAACVVLLAPAQKWDLKVPYEEDTVSKMAIVMEMDMDGETAAVDLIAELAIKKTTDKGFDAVITWRDIYVDDEPMGEISFDVTLNKRGMPVSTDSDFGDDIRRMALPLLFVFPESPVGAGDTWSFSHEKGEGGSTVKVTMEFKVKGVEKVGEADALKVEVKITESGEFGMSAEGISWVGKDGRVLKFETNVKNWPVPMAGSSADVRITGRLIKSKSR